MATNRSPWRTLHPDPVAPAPVQPAGLPEIGSTVYFRASGTKKRPVGFVIRGYRLVAGTDLWVFDATGPWGMTGRIEMLGIAPVTPPKVR